jgi:hypothetical protein
MSAAGLGGRVEVEGLRAAQKQLAALGADKSEYVSANVEAAETLIRQALPLVPVRTGALRQTLRPAKVQSAAVARAGLNSVPYANPIHWGWLVVAGSHKGKLKAGTYRGIKPQPFFSKALGLSYQEIVRDYDERLSKLFAKYGFGE